MQYDRGSLSLPLVKSAMTPTWRLHVSAKTTQKSRTFRRTYDDTPETVHDADGRYLRGLPLRGLDLIVVRIVVREQRLRDGADVVDV